MQRKVILQKKQAVSSPGSDRSGASSTVVPVVIKELILTCAGGLEPVLAEEIKRLGYSVTARNAGVVRCAADAAAIALLTRQVRTASRVLVPLTRFSADTFDGVYRETRRLPWERIIPSSLTFAISSSTRSPRLKDHRFLAMRIKDALVDRQREGGDGRRSSVDRHDADMQVVVFADERNMIDISLDAGGAPLHERGYRTEAGDAPLRETVAAAMLLNAGYTGEQLLIDPFCGSGTIAIEAALLAAGMPPHGPRRGMAYTRWPWYVSVQSTSDTDQEAIASPPVPSGGPRIFASDHDAALVELARRNARRAGVEHLIEWSVSDMRECISKLSGTGGAGGSAGGAGAAVLLVTNPPYGERLNPADLHELYGDLGPALRSGFAGRRSARGAWVLCSEPELIRRTGLPVRSETMMYNGGIQCRLYRLDIPAPTVTGRNNR